MPFVVLYCLDMARDKDICDGRNGAMVGRPCIRFLVTLSSSAFWTVCTWNIAGTLSFRKEYILIMDKVTKLKAVVNGRPDSEA